MEKMKKLPRSSYQRGSYRRRSHYYCRAHIQFMSSLTSSLRSQVDFPHYERERAPPVHPVLCEQHWMLSLRYNKCALCSVHSGHQPAKTKICTWRMKQNHVRATMWRRSVQCVCLLQIYIWNNEPGRARKRSIIFQILWKKKTNVP